METAEKKTGLSLLREPFPPHQIGKLAKGSKEQMTCPASEKKNCQVCGGWHHPKLVHLDFVGHAALTDRLLDADPNWYWEPLACGPDGLPAFDSIGGLWINLTVCGMTRIGYGNAEKSQYKEIGSREKEVIGDALRNAAMRFGAALELWHKGDLHIEEKEEELIKMPAPPDPMEEHCLADFKAAFDNAGSCKELDEIAAKMKDDIGKSLGEVNRAKLMLHYKAVKAGLSAQGV